MFYVGERAETAEDCARRLSQFLSALGALDPLLASWFKVARSRKAALMRPIDSSAQALRDLLREGQARREDAVRSGQ
jgi:hypothetical protein